MTAEAMLAIRDGTIVDGHFDTAGHLILTKYDGTLIDGGAVLSATTGQSGIVELATNAETQAGTDTTRAVTPAGLASLPGYRVQIVSGIAESATPASWPYATSLQSVSAGSGWTPNGGAGTIVTESIDSTRTAQIFYENSGGTASTKAWVREYNSAVGGGGWTSWAQMMLMVQLNAASFTQTTTRGNYPAGLSRLYYTSGTSSAWDFAGMAGEVETYIEGTDFGRQTFTQHVGGSNTPVRWFRTATSAGGWTAWQKTLVDPGVWQTWTPTWGTTSGLHLPSYGNASVNAKAFKLGKKVDVTFDVTFGSTTNFGSGATTTDNWTLGLPPAWPANTAVGTFLGIGDVYRNSTNLGFTRIKVTGSTAVSFNLLTCFVAGALGGGIGGDIDSITPWTWASSDALRGTFSYETTA
jgi:hypothetical protein